MAATPAGFQLVAACDRCNANVRPRKLRRAGGISLARNRSIYFSTAGPGGAEGIWADAGGHGGVAHSRDTGTPALSVSAMDFLRDIAIGILNTTADVLSQSSGREAHVPRLLAAIGSHVLWR